ncbi:glycosyl hydrolase family 8 [Pseudobacteroides cellulosolvens]|uniref:Glycoside hydrolase family 8 n=1 Tax=Pseudobacteroides cellulosolvens ATCC 35603 = DSM 2933 TaxID=398512 RepID=A0A0L6JHM1_9FIRM|nr:glycosyl hydrolase family 8 [Pseudobacteroides cellulosolvens]KNY25208.1 glycoside hydrolase family 8 [Pseudobacteroides cellulosolvens ATCC 35603 = DSM 2933]
MGPEKDRETWKKVAATSREFFKKTTHPTTGLAPDYANFDGSPKSVSWGTEHVDFRYDAWRTVNNSAFDYAWFKKDAWANTYADRIQDFFVSKGRTTYGGCYKLDGTQTNNDHSPGLVAMNAVASLAATKAQAYDFVEDLWKLSAPSGQYRYYDGCLFMFGLLHVSGNFRIWGGPDPIDPTDPVDPTNTPKPTIRPLTPAAIRGDLSNDGVINMADVILLATKFNAIDGDGKYVSAYDLTDDGVINMADVVIIGKYFGKNVMVVTENPTKASAPTNTPTPTPIPSAKTTIKVMPLGDSITDGLTVPGGYRIKLWQQITSNGFKVDFVGSMSNGPSELGDKNHEGHSGWTISQIDTNINTWMDTYKPQIVLLHIGTNDMYQTPSGAPDRLGTLIDKICAKLPTGGKLYVSDIIPFPMSASNVTAYNAKIPGVVQQKASAGKPVYFVEMYKALTSNDLADGVHPNATGYNKMADVWFNAIKADLGK